jgi:TM2 domain-containing membrane protein YozV
MKNKWTSLWLCLFLGWLGVHRFYEGKIPTGILYLCTLGLCGVGVLVDMWYILMVTPNKHVAESGQYETYLKVVEALQQSGYSVNEYEREWCIVRASVMRDSKLFNGNIFIVGDPRPGLLSSIIGGIFPKYKEFRYSWTQYGSFRRIMEMLRNTFKRKGFNFNPYYYWPEDSLVAGYMSEPDEDVEWLTIVKSVLDKELWK